MWEAELEACRAVVESGMGDELRRKEVRLDVSLGVGEEGGGGEGVIGERGGGACDMVVVRWGRWSR